MRTFPRQLASLKRRVTAELERAAATLARVAEVMANPRRCCSVAERAISDLLLLPGLVNLKGK